VPPEFHIPTHHTTFSQLLRESAALSTLTSCPSCRNWLRVLGTVVCARDLRFKTNSIQCRSSLSARVTKIKLCQCGEIAHPHCISKSALCRGLASALQPHRWAALNTDYFHLTYSFALLLLLLLLCVSMWRTSYVTHVEHNSKFRTVAIFIYTDAQFQFVCSALCIKVNLLFMHKPTNSHLWSCPATYILTFILCTFRSLL
jgi:hypothetical protein